MSTVSARPLTLATRGSALAVAQAQAVADRLAEQTGRPVRLTRVATSGDRSAAALVELGGTGAFVGGLRDRLLAGAADLAVHSLKDLPTTPTPGLLLAAVPTRADPRDCLVSRHPGGLAGLPAAATVGTGSPRRAAQLRRHRPDLRVLAVRGNVDTRLARVGRGEVDAVLVAAAGLARLGRAGEATELVDPAVVLPAAGQGALAVECRAADEALAAELAGLEDPVSRAAVTAERVLLAALGAGCAAPVGALAVPEQGEGDRPVLRLRAAVLAADGSAAVGGTAFGGMDDPAELGRRLAGQLLADGADRYLAVPR